jgi:2-polyprenyl-6-hydroxyphenyl methylase/3-demethylubiquinone-9 3-methyltransferase
MSAPADVLAALALPFAAAQGALMMVDERAFHRVRGLGEWESWGHVADSAVFAAALLPAALLAPGRAAALLYALGAAGSTVMVAKDEWIHARECEPAEHWVHALLFSLHPCVLLGVGALWARGEGALFRATLPLVVAAYSFYQWRYWLGGRRFRRETEPLVDNEFYDELGVQWHEGDGHAISLLRAESPVRLAYVRDALARAGAPANARILDVGCGGGFLSNPLAAAGFRVKGVDRSAKSLDAAREKIPAGADATYAVGDAFALGEPPASYDAVLMMDLLEHLDEPARAVAEAAKALKPGGLLFFHTFNRTPEAWLLAVKGIGFVTREGPSNVHSLSMFIKPAELMEAGRKCGLERRDLTGIRPVLDGAFLSSLLRRRVHPDFAFTLTRSTRVGYVGCFAKPLLALALALFALGRAAAATAPAPSLQHRLAVSPDEARALDTRTLAELIVGRIRRECESSGAAALGEGARLIVMVPAGALESIARDGFLNQHQTLTTGGHRRERDRFEAEQELAMLRLPFGFKGRELLPKYAVVDAPGGDVGQFRLPTRYGDVAVVFKPEVAARATWTYADSLDFSRKTGRYDRGGSGNPVLARTFAYARKKEDVNRCGNYCEAQIWGELSLRDAAYVMIRDSEPVPAAAARLGLSVRRYAADDKKTAAFTDAAEANYLRQRDESRLSDEALVAAVERSTEAADAGGFSPRQRLLGELAARPKNTAVVAELEKLFASPDEQTRALALYGLSERGWPELKPKLLAALDAPAGPLLISAVAFAADHQDDPEIAARLEALRKSPASDATEWVERALKNRLCGP